MLPVSYCIEQFAPGILKTVSITGTPSSGLVIHPSYPKQAFSLKPGADGIEDRYPSRSGQGPCNACFLDAANPDQSIFLMNQVGAFLAPSTPALFLEYLRGVLSFSDGNSIYPFIVPPQLDQLERTTLELNIIQRLHLTQLELRVEYPIEIAIPTSTPLPHQLRESFFSVGMFDLDSQLDERQYACSLKVLSTASVTSLADHQVEFLRFRRSIGMFRWSG
jgi:hypothetical protein